MTPDPELTGLAIVVLVLVVLLTWWLQRARKAPQGPDVGLAVFVEDPTCCDDGCEECGAPMVIDEPFESLCACNAFNLWYVDENGPPIRVCRCGHPDGEHLFTMGSCTGETIVHPGEVSVQIEERPWWYDDFDSTGDALAYYGSRLVHQKCLIARRDGLAACTCCAAILSAVAL